MTATSNDWSGLVKLAEDNIMSIVDEITGPETEARSSSKFPNEVGMSLSRFQKTTNK